MRQYFPQRRLAVAVAALLTAMAASAAPAAEPEVLKEIPADAYGVVVINNARTFANKVANAAARLQLPIPPDLIGAATRSMGIDEGFDVNSSAALVFLKPGPDREGLAYFQSLPPAVILLPTTNSKAMLDNYKPGDPDKDGISQVSLPQDPEQKGFVAVIDKKWIAFAQKREDLASYLARGDSFAAKASPDTLKVFDANDLVIWGNVEKLGQGVDKWLDDQRAGLTGMLDLKAFNNQGDPYAQALQKQGINMVFNFVKQFFTDAGAGMLTVRLTDSGATLGLVGDFKPESSFGKFVAAQAGRGPVTLKGLPGGNFLIAGTAHWNSGSISGLIGNITDQFLADPAIAKDPKADDIRKAFDAARQMMAITQGMNMVLLDPPAGGKGGLLNGAALMETSDPQKFIDLEMQSLKNPIAQSTMNADLKTSVAIGDSIKVKDVQLTRLSVKFALRDETPENPISAENRQAFEIIQRMYGKDGLSISFGIVGKRVIVLYGTDSAMMESAITAAQENTEALSTNAAINSVKDDVVANPVAIFYLPAARWVALAPGLILPGMKVNAASDPAINTAPPMVMSAGVSGKMLTAEIHVPIASVTAIQEAVKQLGTGMQGGPGNRP
jgi:hypothetical protein